MTAPARFDRHSRIVMQADADGFIVQPRWRLIFQDQRVDEHVTPARDGPANNEQDLAVSLKVRAIRLSRLALHPLHPLRRTG